MSSNYQNYLPAMHPCTVRLLAAALRMWRASASGQSEKLKELVIFCIGTARVPGDSLGPLVGEALSRRSAFLEAKSIYVAGTTRRPIHAENLPERYALTKQTHPDALIVAVDAGLGAYNQVGKLAVWEGSLSPGIALAKSLPPVGDFGIAGIVGVSGPESFQALQNAPGHLVKKMADRISHAICHL